MKQLVQLKFLEHRQLLEQFVRYLKGRELRR